MGKVQLCTQSHTSRFLPDYQRIPELVWRPFVLKEILTKVLARNEARFRLALRVIRRSILGWSSPKKSTARCDRGETHLIWTTLTHGMARIVSHAHKCRGMQT